MKNNMIYELHVGIFILPSGFALLHIFVMVRISRTIRKNMALNFLANFGHNVFRYIYFTDLCPINLVNRWNIFTSASA